MGKCKPNRDVFFVICVFFFSLAAMQEIMDQSLNLMKSRTVGKGGFDIQKLNPKPSPKKACVRFQYSRAQLLFLYMGLSCPFFVLVQRIGYSMV